MQNNTAAASASSTATSACSGAAAVRPAVSTSTVFYSEHCIPNLEAKYVVGAEVGRGSYSTVRQVTERSTGAPYVCKFSSLQEGSGYNPEEGQILMMASHENITKAVDMFFSPTHCGIVMEDLSHGGELFSALSNRGGVPFPESTVAHYMHGLLSALRYLHDDLGVVHRDVKLENIMLTEPAGSSVAECGATVKLIDFGFSKRIGRAKSLNVCCGSPNYMSPEMLRATRTQDQNASLLPTKHQPYGNEVDMWAAGVAMYVLLVGRYPFYHEKRTMWHKAILMGQYTIPSTVTVSDECKDLLSRLLTVRIEERLTAEEALRHDWFRVHVPAEVASRDNSSSSLATTPVRRTKAVSPPLTSMAAAPVAASSVSFTPPHNFHALMFETPTGKQGPAAPSAASQQIAVGNRTNSSEMMSSLADARI